MITIIMIHNNLWLEMVIELSGVQYEWLTKSDKHVTGVQSV